MKKNIPHQTFKPINWYVYKMITHFTMASKSMEMCQNLDFAEKKCLQIRQVVSQNFMYGALNLGASVEHHLDLPCQLVNARRGDYSWLTNGVCVGGSGGRLVHRLVVHCLMSCLRLFSINGDAG